MWIREMIWRLQVSEEGLWDVRVKRVRNRDVHSELCAQQKPYVLKKQMEGVCVCVCVCVCVVTLSCRVKLLRQQVIAAAHAADCGQLSFSHKHPQGAGSQVATRVQADHDRFLEIRRKRTEKGEKSRRGGDGRGEIDGKIY